MPHVDNEGDDPSADGDFDPNVEEGEEGEEMNGFLAEDLPKVGGLAAILFANWLTRGDQTF